VTIDSADVAQAVHMDKPHVTIDDVAGGSLTVGHTLGIDNGTFDLMGGTLTAAHIVIQHGGQLEATGTGTSTIGASVTNNGHIKVSSGTLDFQKEVGKEVSSSSSKTGTDGVSDGATLEFDKKVFADQHIFFGKGGGTLDLTDPKVFFARIHDFGTGDTISLAGAWTFVSLSNPTTGTTDLVLGSAGLNHKFVFVGDYTQSVLPITQVGSNTTITFG
jgi:hypothetical protein